MVTNLQNIIFIWMASLKNIYFKKLLYLFYSKCFQCGAPYQGWSPVIGGKPQLLPVGPRMKQAQRPETLVREKFSTTCGPACARVRAKQFVN